MNLSESYISEFLLLELEILKTSGYQPDLNKNILAKIFKEIDFQNLTTNEEIITKIFASSYTLLTPIENQKHPNDTIKMHRIYLIIDCLESKDQIEL